ncbi:MAG: hypothetical protein ABGY11_13190 [Candidatus Thioglobus sp.]
MSIEVNIENNGEGIEIVATGVVTGNEIIKAHKKIYDKAHLSCQKYHIIDKSKCIEYDVSAKDIESIAELDGKASEINPNIIIAIIESESLQFSLTETWQEYLKLNKNLFNTKSFTDRNSAIEWIAENKI